MSARVARLGRIHCVEEEPDAAKEEERVEGGWRRGEEMVSGGGWCEEERGEVGSG